MAPCTYSRSHAAPVRWASLLVLLLITGCGREPDPSSAFATPAATGVPAQTQATVQPYLVPGQTYTGLGEVTAVTPAIGYLPQPYPRPPGEVTAATPSIDYVPKVLGLVIDGDGVVLHVEPQSGAEAAGIAVGDQITAINGVDFQQDRAGAKSQLRSTPPEDAVHISVKKRQHSGTVEIAVMRQYQGHGDPPNGATPTPVLPPADYL